MDDTQEINHLLNLKFGSQFIECESPKCTIFVISGTHFLKMVIETKLLPDSRSDLHHVCGYNYFYIIFSILLLSVPIGINVLTVLKACS